jgi:hypothetical protein
MTGAAGAPRRSNRSSARGATRAIFLEVNVSVAALIVAIVTGGVIAAVVIGALLVFTGGRRRWDLVAGQLGALAGLGVLVLASGGPPNDILAPALAGLAGAMLAVWINRAFAWRRRPEVRMSLAASFEDATDAGVKSTSEMSLLWIRDGRLVAPDSTH